MTDEDEDEVELISRKRKHETQLTDAENSKKKRKITTDSDDTAINTNKNIALEDIRVPEFFNIPEFSRQFGQSRQAYLAKMTSYLNTYDSALAPMIAIIGMGGIGKSQLAKKLAYDMRESFQHHCYWIRANSEVALHNDFETLASVLNIREANRQLMIKAVYRRLNQLDRILLVFDDVPDENSIAAYLPPDSLKKSKFTLLITSRNKVAWSSCYRVELSPSSKDLKEDGIAYLQAFLNQANETELEQQITQLAECLGYLPLALAQAANYIEESQITIKEYIELFEQEKEALLDQPVTRQDNYDLTVRTTWNISFKQVIEKNAKAGKLLNLCAYFAAHEIPKALFLAELTGNSQIQFNEIIKLLRSYSLIEDCADRKFFLLHCLLQNVIQLNLKKENNHHTFLRQVMILLNKYFTYRHDAHIDIELINNILVHVLVAIEHCEKVNKVKEFSEVAELYYRVGLYYLDYRYDITKAKKYLHHAEAFSENLNTDAKQAAKVYRQLFKAYLQNAIKAKAKTKAKTDQKKDKYFKQAKLYLEKVQEITGSTLETECDYANYYLTKIEYLDNETLTDEGIQKVKADRETIKQQLHETKKHLDNAFSLLKNLPNTSESYVAMLHHYQGNYHSKFGHYDEAIKAYAKALAIKVKLQDNREIGRTTHAFGQIYMKLYQAKKEFKNFIKAYEYLIQALRQRLFFHHTIAHLEVIDTLSVLGGLYAMYDKKDAIVYREKAILVRLVLAKALISLHRTDVTNDRELMALYFKAGRYTEARQYFNQLPNERKTLLENERKKLFQKQLPEYLSNNFPIKPKLEVKDYSAEAIANLLLIDKMSSVDASHFSSDSNTPQLIVTSIELLAEDNLNDAVERIPIADSIDIPDWILENLPGLEYQAVPGDGNCLFYVVALYTGQSQQILRNIVAAHIENNLEEFRAFIVLPPGQTIKDYVQALRAEIEWADNIEIEVLMRVLNRPIIVIDSEGKIRNEEALQRFNGEPIFVHYNGHNHYNAFLCKEGYSIPAILEQLKQLASYVLLAFEHLHAISNESWSQQHENVDIRLQQDENTLDPEPPNHNSIIHSQVNVNLVINQEQTMEKTNHLERTKQDKLEMYAHSPSVKIPTQSSSHQHLAYVQQYHIKYNQVLKAIEDALKVITTKQTLLYKTNAAFLQNLKKELIVLKLDIDTLDGNNFAQLIFLQQSWQILKESVQDQLNELEATFDSSNKMEQFTKNYLSGVFANLKQTFEFNVLATEFYEETEQQLVHKAFISTHQEIRQLTSAKPKCFISYAWGITEHEQLATKVAAHLMLLGFEVWLDRWSNSAGGYISYFTAKIREADYVILLGSKKLVAKYMEGKALYEEVQAKRQQLDFSQSPMVNRNYIVNLELHQIFTKGLLSPGSIVPLLLDGTLPECLPPNDLQNLVPIHLTEHRDTKIYSERMFELVQVLLPNTAVKDLIDKHQKILIERLRLLAKHVPSEAWQQSLADYATKKQQHQTTHQTAIDETIRALTDPAVLNPSIYQPVRGIHYFQGSNTYQPQNNNNNNSNTWTNYSASNTNTQAYQNPSPK